MALTQQQIDYWNQKPKTAKTKPSVPPSGSYWTSGKSPEQMWLDLSSRPLRGTVSKYRGVQLNTGHQTKPFRAMLVYRGRRYYGGAFATQEEAALKWNELVMKHIGPAVSSILNEVPGH